MVVVENNYLSQKQQAQKDKEIAECQSMVCKAGAQAKWTAIDLGQDGSFAAGMIAGVPAGLYDTVDGIVKTASSPVETYEALKSLFNSGDVLGNVSDAVKQSYIDRIDRMEAEYQKAGASGSFNAGVEGGKLVTDIAGLLAGGAGVVKGGTVLTEKVVAKVVSKTEKAISDIPPSAWKSGEGTFSPKSDKTVTNVEHPGGQYDGNSLPYKDKVGTVTDGKDYTDILSPEAKQHILYGDSPTSGGHIFPGNPGKTTFPSNWTAEKIVHEIGDIATSPSTQWYAQTGTGGLYTGKGDPAKWVAYEVRDGVRLRVVYQPVTGKVITAFPDSKPIPVQSKPIKK